MPLSPRLFSRAAEELRPHLLSETSVEVTRSCAQLLDRLARLVVGKVDALQCILRVEVLCVVIQFLYEAVSVVAGATGDGIAEGALGKVLMGH